MIDDFTWGITLRKWGIFPRCMSFPGKIIIGSCQCDIAYLIGSVWNEPRGSA